MNHLAIVAMTPLACFLCTLCLAVSMVAAGNSSTEVEDCDIRFEDNGACACSSSDKYRPVNCSTDSDKTITIQQCYCMYYDPTQNLSIVGHCYYSCYKFHGTKKRITSSIQFNDDICSQYGHLNRIGRFCGRCNDTYGLAAYSYQLFSCIPCQNYGYRNWLRYFAVALLPLTVFYIAAVLLSFNVTSSSLNGIVFVMQCLLSPLQVTLLQGSTPVMIKYHANLLKIKVFTSIFCTLNLDFFRLVYPPFCLHPEANIFQILSLDYIVALYPFLLIFMTYVLVTAYDKQYRLVVWMWRPVQRCVQRHRNTWNIRTSLIEIFATFILFSYVKILGVSVQILAFTSTQDVAGNKLNNYYTIFDGTIKYFGSAHLPYALLAIIISSVFVVLPFLLLAVYPCRCFHKCLNSCGLRSPVLHIFMDAFQGSYRIEPRDLRYFSAFYLLLRILMVVQFQFFTEVMLFTSGILSLVAAVVVAVFQPYKVKSHNIIDSVLMVLLGMFFLSYHAQLPSCKSSSDLVPLAVENISKILLLLYFIPLLAWKLLGGKLRATVRMVKVIWGAMVCHTTECRRSGERFLESFDRETDSGEPTGEPNTYSPLLTEQNSTY